ncbi:hypothetical protein NDU88_003774 [Pleurodeles waltl]|uniref:Uncharacterized protein n=1 Tax=Pleurodeles waltl TaxID=8319 RepID=A0AAV7W725_PLEWA|nr:hypothetical protein NDU88_003774 [Pleurodeles waltl]
MDHYGQQHPGREEQAPTLPEFRELGGEHHDPGAHENEDAEDQSLEERPVVLRKMDKADKNQAKLQFDRCKPSGPAGDAAELGPEKGNDTFSGEEQDLRQILVAMQHSLTQIDGKIDSLSYRMDRMTERLDKHAERLDQSERRVSEVEDDQTELATSQVKLNKELNSLRLKVDDLEARSWRKNLRIVGVAESTAIDNMEGFVERLLVQLLGRATFSDLLVVERAHRSLATCSPSGASPRPIIARLLNYRACDAALCHARELKTLQYEGMTISLYNFTKQVQEARRQFTAGKKQLRDLHLEYRMLYTAKLGVEVDGSSLFFTDHKKLDQFVKRRTAGKENCNVDDTEF